jgi:hypothetical protein
MPIHISGRDWESGDFVSYDEMINIFTTSRINLNFSSGQRQIKARVFEVCLAGGFLLTEYVLGIERYFEIDKEIVCFKNSYELIEKIIYYLNHDAERRAIARAGWERSKREYSCVHMFSKVFQEIENDIETNGRPCPTKSKLPLQIRKKFADYYFDWGEACLLENYKGLWKDALELSIRYYPMNTRAWRYYIVGFFPFSARNALIRHYRILYNKFGFMLRIRRKKEKFITKLCGC